jgi:hypothetical protein
VETETAPEITSDAQAVEKLITGRARVETELSKVIVGQKEVVEQILLALFSGGHCLITGAPGLAKTLLVKSIAQIFHLQFQRIQFTPDLMPADITGTEILSETEGGGRRLTFVKGPGCWKRCRNIKSLRPECGMRCRNRSLCSRRKTRSRWKVPIRCLKRNSIVSCSMW